MNLWKWVGKICSLTPLTRKWALNSYYRWKKSVYQHRFGNTLGVLPQMVVFEAYMGKKYACSPKALYEAMLQDKKYDSWVKVWAFREPEKYKFLEKNANTRVISYRKAEYYRAYAQAKYWITNSRLPRELCPKDNQEYIQCWHGTPLKKLGFDLKHYAEKEGSLEEVRDNYLLEAKRITKMPSPSKFYSQKMYTAFDLKRYGKKNVFLEYGYPRNDRLYQYTKEECVQIRKRLGIPEDKKVILYAPTWRENQHVPGEGYTYQLQVDFSKWRQELGSEYIVLFRAHYFISNVFEFEKYKGFVYDVSCEDDINDLYLIADVLVTDYSSVFFDYANLRKPIIFYMYDYDAYKYEMRDFYLDESIFPGPVVRTQEQLLEQLKRTDEIVAEYKEKYDSFNQMFNPHREACAARYLNEWL